VSRYWHRLVPVKGFDCDLSIVAMICNYFSDDR
jgi:hypothetical protein